MESDGRRLTTQEELELYVRGFPPLIAMIAGVVGLWAGAYEGSVMAIVLSGLVLLVAGVMTGLFVHTQDRPERSDLEQNAKLLAPVIAVIGLPYLVEAISLGSAILITLSVVILFMASVMTAIYALPRIRSGVSNTS